MKIGAYRAGPLWAVTSYFNPVGYHRRRENYRIFRRQLAVPLATVELSFNGRFELRPADAEILIQIHGRDVMWQKERLLNVAALALPASCTQVAILDCDVVFTRPDWPQALSRKLEQFPLAQPFSTVHYIPRDVAWDGPQALGGEYTRPSVGMLVEEGLTGWQVMGQFSGRQAGVRATGHALAARRELLQTHGLYDANIIGSGDASLMAAAFGLFDEALQYQRYSEPQRAHYRAWARPFARDVRGQIGCTAGDLIHLWHGDMSDRGTLERHARLADFGFDPQRDLAVERSGCWRWNSDKPAMHKFVRDYFASRHEDGRQSSSICPSLLQSAAA